MGCCIQRDDSPNYKSQDRPENNSNVRHPTIKEQQNNLTTEKRMGSKEQRNNNIITQTQISQPKNKGKIHSTNNFQSQTVKPQLNSKNYNETKESNNHQTLMSSNNMNQSNTNQINIQNNNNRNRNRKIFDNVQQVQTITSNEFPKSIQEESNKNINNNIFFNQRENTSMQLKDKEITSNQQNQQQQVSQESKISNKQKIQSTQLFKSDISKQKACSVQNTDSQNKSRNQSQNCKYQYNITYLDNCDCIQIEDSNKSTKEFFVLSKFTVYFGQFNLKNSQKEGKGLILQRYFDRNFNSSYFHYEGQFKDDQIVGSGKLFNQKSKIMLQQGGWATIQNTLHRQPLIEINKKIRIINEISSNANPRTFQSDSTLGFHDQLLNKNDLAILQSKGWLNSSIIDAYVEHLNYQNEVQYWSMRKDERKQYKRLCIIPSWLFSWFHKGQDDQNLKYFQEIYSQFEPIQYRIWEIYKKIGFVINSSNMHWYFVQLDFDTMEMIIKDSMRGGEYKYETTVNILQNLLQKIDKNIQLKTRVCQECPQQRNGYDCGAYTCMNVKKLADGSLIDNGSDMRQQLIKFIQYHY